MIIGMLLLLVVIQCRLATHPVQISLSFSTNGLLIQYQWKGTNNPLKYNALRCRRLSMHINSNYWSLFPSFMFLDSGPHRLACGHFLRYHWETSNAIRIKRQPIGRLSYIGIEMSLIIIRGTLSCMQTKFGTVFVC